MCKFMLILRLRLMNRLEYCRGLLTDTKRRISKDTWLMFLSNNYM